MILQANNIVIKYDNTTVINNVSLEIDEGSFITLIGANGAGKTTMLRSISGLKKIASGSILFEDRPIENMAPSKILRLGIAHVPEGRRVFPGLNVPSL